MTRVTTIVDALTPLIADLASDVLLQEHCSRLISALHKLLQCDAVALLRLEGTYLLPVAISGLSPDTLGRRFVIDEQPRLKAILESSSTVLFASDCALPDPYDGLIDSDNNKLFVHDCMGCVVKVDGHIWGVMTLDALDAGSFGPDQCETLALFASLAAATVAAAIRFEALSEMMGEENPKIEAYHSLVSAPVEKFIGESDAFTDLRAQIDLVAPTELTVLVSGETGTGKELVARRIYQQSKRADKIFVAVNCATLPENLIESELFGHVRGAFSGAVEKRKGKFLLANGGTLFLDEIGELPLTAQAKLLRVLQEKKIQPLGADYDVTVDIRLIAATNRELDIEVASGRFRADLFHRLRVFPLHVPLLRERGIDILLLSGVFLDENRSRLGVRMLRLSPAARKVLLAYEWPGNVRELEHLIARASLHAYARHINLDHQDRRQAIVTLDVIDLDVSDRYAIVQSGTMQHQQEVLEMQPFYVGNLREAVDAFQRDMIKVVLSRHSGNMSAAARSLGLDRANLVRISKRLNIVN